MPNILVVDAKGTGVARCGLLRGGIFFEQIGPNLPAKVDTATGFTLYKNLACRFRGRLYVLLGMKVYRYNPDTNAWDTAYDATSWASPNFQNGSHSGLHLFLNAAKTQLLMGAWLRRNYDNNNWVIFTADGTNWTYVSHAGAVLNNNLPQTIGDFQGSFYARATYPNAASCTHWDGTGIVVENNVWGDPGTASGGVFFTVDDRFFCLLSQRQGHDPALCAVEELVLGSWVKKLIGVPRFQNAGYNGNVGGFRIGDSFYAFGAFKASAGTGASTGLACMRFYVSSPGAALAAVDVSDPVVPEVIRHTTPATIGMPSNYQCVCFVDNETDPASPVGYVMFIPGSTNQTPTLFRFNGTPGAEAEMTVVGTPQATGWFAFTETVYGGGQVLNGLAGSTPLVTGRVQKSEKGDFGLKLTFELRGDQTRLDHGAVSGGTGFETGETVLGGSSGATATIDFVGSTGLYLLLHNVVGGPFSAGEQITQTTGAGIGSTATLEHVLRHGAVTGGPFEAGESILGGSSGATAVITEVGLNLIKVDTVVGGPFQALETITQTTGINAGAVATTTAAAPEGSTGGAADKVARFRYFLGAGNTGQGVPSTGLCTLVPGTLIGGGSLQAGNTEIGGLIADAPEILTTDPVPVHSVEWDFLGDGVPEGLVERIQLEAVRP